MDAEKMRNRCFHVQKWTVVALSGVVIVLPLVLISLPGAVSSAVAYHLRVWVTIITDLFVLMGCYGVFTEKFCATFNYAVFMNLCAIVTLYQSFHQLLFLTQFATELLVCVLAYGFAQKLRKLAYLREQTRLQQQRIRYLHRHSSVDGQLEWKWQDDRPPKYEDLFATDRRTSQPEGRHNASVITIT